MQHMESGPHLQARKFHWSNPHALTSSGTSLQFSSKFRLSCRVAHLQRVHVFSKPCFPHRVSNCPDPTNSCPSQHKESPGTTAHIRHKRDNKFLFGIRHGTVVVHSARSHVKCDNLAVLFKVFLLASSRCTCSRCFFSQHVSCIVGLEVPSLVARQSHCVEGRTRTHNMGGKPRTQRSTRNEAWIIKVAPAFLWLKTNRITGAFRTIPCQMRHSCGLSGFHRWFCLASHHQAVCLLLVSTNVASNARTEDP